MQIFFFSDIMTISYMQNEACQSVLPLGLVYQLFYVDFMKVLFFPFLISATIFLQYIKFY